MTTILHFSRGDVHLTHPQRKELMDALFQWQEGEFDGPKFIRKKDECVVKLKGINVVATEKELLDFYNTEFEKAVMDTLNTWDTQRMNYEFSVHQDPDPPEDHECDSGDDNPYDL